MSARKFYHWDTGGGCTALRRDLPDGRYYLITDDGGADAPRKGQKALIGYYDKEDNPIGNGARLIKWTGVRRPVSGPVEVRTYGYVWSHGHAPRGRGAWAFRTGKREQFIQGIHTYAEAKRIAIAEARRMGDTVIEVLP